MICFDFLVKWYKAIDEYTHLLIEESECHEYEDGLYVEYTENNIKIKHNISFEDYHSGWNWVNLPEEKHKMVKELYQNGEWAKLLSIHNKYQLSSNSYCCPTKSIELHFGHAIENKII